MNPLTPFERIATGPLVRGLVSKLVRNGAITYGPRRGRRVALTFDDGPHPKWTPRVLEVLARHEALATFFVVGSHVDENRELAREIASQGHELALHSYDHHRQLVCDGALFRVDLQKAMDAVTRAVDRQPRYYRYPYGTAGQDTDRVVDELRLQRVYWSFSAADGYLPSARQIASRVTSLVRPGAIVLMHDCLADEATTRPPYRPDRTELVKALDTILAALKRASLTPVTLSTLLDVSA